MSITGRQGVRITAIAACAAAALGTAAVAGMPGEPPASDDSYYDTDTFTKSQTATKRQTAPQVASRDMTRRYYQAFRLIGSLVLNLDGQRIGQVDDLILDKTGNVKQVLVDLNDAPGADGGAVGISPHRAEVVSTEGARVTVIRVDLTREELIQAQLVRLKSDARAPAQRGAGTPDMHREYGPLY